jgi:uncharacterized RDD family membrane protein YckC
MSITCHQCNQVFSTLGDTPRFCSNCGAQLKPDIGDETNLANDADRTQSFTLTSEGDADPVRPNRIRHDVTQAPSSGSTQPNEGSVEQTGAVGADIGPFRLGRVLGSGGMGTVFEATDREHGQKVALKLLSRQLRGTPETVQRFQRESQIAASINHPRSTFVYQAGQEDDQIYITMELMNGGTLKDVVEEEGPLPVERAVDYMLDIISGLKVAHQAGVVHRDLKPSNCFVDDNGRVKVGDFGLSKSFVADSSLTQTGMFMGTPQYAAPEQLRSSDVDAKADIYAVGGTLFYLLTGRAPFVGNAAQVIASIATDPPPNVKTLEPNVPRKLAKLINQTLEKDPAKRPVDLEEIRLALRSFSSRGKVAAPPGLRLAAFFIDVICGSIIASLLAMPLTIFVAIFAEHLVPFVSIATPVIGLISYFALLEWKWGTTPGKWLLGLRVINDEGEFPSFFQSLTRSFLLPGLQQAVAIFPAFLFNQADAQELNKQMLATIAELQIVAFASWLPNIVCLMTARAKNGYRGIHELGSKTRVVRLSGSLETARPNRVPCTIPLATSPSVENFTNVETAFIGNYLITGKIKSNDDPSKVIFAGKDKTLDRSVWIFQTNQSSDSKRTVAIRPTRQRIIVEQKEGDKTYQVAEAIEGMPLIEFIRTAPTTQWASFRPIIRELAYEFLRSEEESSFPADFSLANIWIDRSGRSKLLSQAVTTQNLGTVENNSNQNAYEDSDVAPTTPHQAIQTLLDEIIEHHAVPVHVAEFRDTIEPNAKSPELNSIGKTLGTFANKPSAWSWIDKFGVISIFMAIEFSTLFSLGAIWALMVPTQTNLTPVQASLIFACVSTLIVAVVGYLTAGGISLKVSEVAVCQSPSLKAASKFRCMLRTLVTWTLPIISLSAGVFIMCAGIMLELHNAGEESAAVHDSTEFIAPALVLVAAGLLSAITVVIALFRPSRGLADLILGTCLARK